MVSLETHLSIEELFDSFDFEAFYAAKQLRRDRPWVFDIIRALWGRPNGLTNQQLYRDIRAIRDPSELPKPKAFEAVIRSALNNHTSQSSQWNGRPEDDLFYSPRGRGTWAVRPQTARAWTEAHDLTEP